MSCKLCTSCKYFRPNNSYFLVSNRLHYGLCIHPSVTTTHLVTGQKTYKRASDVRYNEKYCGTEASHFSEDFPKAVYVRMVVGDVVFRFLFTFFFMLMVFSKKG